MDLRDDWRLREIRAALVGVPPLLADLIRRVIAGRPELSQVRVSIFPEINDLADLAAPLCRLQPDLAIFGQTAATTELTTRLAQLSVRVLVLSADLTHICGSGPEDVEVLTPESLTTALLNAVGNDNRSL